MNWKDRALKNLLIIICLMLTIFTLSAQTEKPTLIKSLTDIEKENLWTDEEVNNLVEDLKIEMENTVELAVKEATINLIVENSTLKEDKKFYIWRIIEFSVISLLTGFLIGSIL